MSAFHGKGIYMIKYGHNTSIALVHHDTYGAAVDGYPNANEEYLDQMWLIEPVKNEKNIYTIRNINSGGYMDLGSNTDGTKVTGETDPGKETQKWFVSKNTRDSTRWKIQNKVQKTFVALRNQREIIGTFGDVTTTGDRHEGWNFECFSITSKEVGTLMRDSHFGNAYHRTSDSLYLLLSRNKISEIFKNANVGNRQWRHELYDSDDFALVAKYQFSEWGNATIKKAKDEEKGTPGRRVALFGIQCGIVFGTKKENGKKVKRAYNFFIERKTNKLVLFNPRGNGEFIDNDGSLKVYFTWT